MRKVLTQNGEIARNRVMNTLARARSATLELAAAPARLSPTRMVLLADPQHYLILPHMAAIAEEFSRRQLIDVSEVLIALDHPFRRAIWRRAESDAEGTWDTQVTAWKRWHDVDLRSAPSYDALRGLIDARNSIMHGLGNLTRKQMRDQGGASTIASLRRVDIGVSGGRLLITPGAVNSCGRAAREFIEWLDLELQDRGLG